MGKTDYVDFTKKSLEGLAPRAKRYNVFDEDTSGLGLTVYPSGVKTFFHLKKVQGWPQRVTIGAFPDLTVEQARGSAAGYNSKLAKWKTDEFEGANPIVGAVEKRVPTLGEVLDHYVVNHLRANAKNPERSERDARQNFERYLAAWRNRPLSSIRREHVRERHAELAHESGGTTANRTVTFLRALFNHATHPDVALWDGANPSAKPKKFLAREAGRDRTLTIDESPAFMRELAAPQTDPQLRDVVLLALFTGQRRGSVLSMRWRDLDLRRGLWTVTTAKSKKNAEPHIVPLVDEAIAVLKRRPRVLVDGEFGEFVFSGRKGALTTVKKPWRAFIERTGIKNLTFHDLRRTLATQEGETGASTEAIQKTLGHAANSAATKIYDRVSRRDEVREAMARATGAVLKAGKVSKRELLGAARA